MGLLGLRPFCGPRFFDYRKQHSLSLHASQSSNGLIQTVVRERKGWETREKQSKVALWQSPISLPGDKHNNIFELFLQILTPLPGGRS